MSRGFRGLQLWARGNPSERAVPADGAAGDTPPRVGGFRSTRGLTNAEAALGVYAMPTPYDTALPYWSSLDSLQQARAKVYYAAFAPWTKENRDAFGRFPQNRVVEFPSANHYLFMTHPDETARVIDAFLGSLL